MRIDFNSNPQVTVNRTEIQTIYDYQEKITHNFDDHSSIDITVASETVAPIPELVTLFYSARQSPASLSPDYYPDQKGQVIIYETTTGHDLDHTIYGEVDVEVPIDLSVELVGDDLILTVEGTVTSGIVSAVYFKYRVSPFNSLEA